MNTGLTSLVFVYVCVQVNPDLIPQKHEAKVFKWGGARYPCLSCVCKCRHLWVYTQIADTVAKSEQKEYTNNIIFHLLSLKQNTDQGKNLVLKCSQVLA